AFVGNTIPIPLGMSSASIFLRRRCARPEPRPILAAKGCQGKGCEFVEAWLLITTHKPEILKRLSNLQCRLHPCRLARPGPENPIRAAEHAGNEIKQKGHVGFRLRSKQIVGR